MKKLFILFTLILTFVLSGIAISGCSEVKKELSREEAAKMIFEYIKDINDHGVRLADGDFNEIGNNIYVVDNLNGSEYAKNQVNLWKEFSEAGLVSVIGIKSRKIKYDDYSQLLLFIKPDTSQNIVGTIKKHADIDKIRKYDSNLLNDFFSIGNIYFSLTEKSIGCVKKNHDKINFISFILKNVEVTGMVQDTEIQITAEFKTEHQYTPFYKWDNKNSLASHAVLKLYDDGWRVVSAE